MDYHTYSGSHIPRYDADNGSLTVSYFTGTCALYISYTEHIYLNDHKLKIIWSYPVLCPKLTLIQPTWSAYPYAPTSLYGIHMPLLPYMVIQPIVLGIVLLWAAMDSSLSQGPLVWRHNDMTVIVSRNTRGPERDTQQRLDNANARRLQTVNR